MSRQLAYHNAPPSDIYDDAPKSAAKAEFSRRLQKAMVDLGLNQSELAKRATKFLEKGHEMGRYSISCYITGKTIPRPDYLNALAKALNLKPRDLLPTRGVPSTGESYAPMDLKDLGNGRAYIRINQDVDWSTALEIIKMLKGEK